MAEDKAKKTVAHEDATKKAPAKAATKEVKKAPAKKAEDKKVEVKKETKADAPKKAEAKVDEKKTTKAAAPKTEPKKEEVKKEVKAKAEPKAKKERYTPKVKVSTNRVVRQYEDVAIKALMEKFKYTSVMQVPKLHKIVINMGVGDATQNPKLLEDAVRELTVIAGQKPVVTIAKKSEASFKLRAGTAIGAKVDLRGERMYDFYEKLISIALPRVRDFRGVNKNSFDGHGNYTLGVREQLIFSEIDFDLVNKVRGMDIVIVTTAKTDAEAYELLRLLGMPFRR
ncbi:MAG: 50S ribosomal protein L5 [Tenericutes bacterium ADurb.Bin239]|nr:MAG: 50S ribosomal protein L5 [Tenericutes bacterium ADurb.Bin239]